MDKDITDQVEFGENDGEFLELVACVCRIKADDQWEFILSTDPDRASECSHCGRKLYFANKITVYEVVEKQGGE